MYYQKTKHKNHLVIRLQNITIGSKARLLMRVYMTKQNIHLKTAVIFLDIGWRVSIPLVIFVILGSILDNKFATKPLFIIIGIILSIFVTTWTFYRLYKQITKEKD